MSKTVRKTKATAVTKVVDVYGSRLVRGSDGAVWLVGTGVTQGSVLTGGNASIAIHKEGVKALHTLAAAQAKFAAAQKAFEVERNKVKLGKQGAYGPMLLGENGSVSVGCTRVTAEDVPKFMKQLGL